MTRALLLAAIPIFAFAEPGLTGSVFVRTPAGGIGPPVSGAAITFIREDLATAATATSDVSGNYSIALAPARYYWIATHASFQDDSSSPGFAVVTGPNRQTANIFLRQPAVTTVIVVRHAEKQNPASDAQNEPLSAAGSARAQLLKQVLFRSGVSAVFSTDTVRTRETVRPLAEAFRLNTQIYDTPANVASRILANHRGDVVVVAAHSNTVAEVANALGASVPAAPVADFDNLILVSRAGSETKAINLQYGASSVPDIVKNSGSAKTFLMTGTTGPAPLPAGLVQAARKSGVGVIRTEGSAPLVAPLASTLGLTHGVFAPPAIDATVDTLLAGASSTVVIAASATGVRAAAARLQATPAPILLPTDTAHIIVVTRFASGAARTVPLRF